MEAESKAFVAWLATYNPARPLVSLSDLSDGAALFDVLSNVDAEYFRHPSRPSQSSDNWVLRLASLKRLFRLITQYFDDVLHQPTSALEVPDLQAIAEHQDISQILALCRLALAVAVQSSRNQEVIEHIRKLNEADQQALMHAIEEVMQKLPKSADVTGEISMTDDDHYYQIQSERSRIIAEKETLGNVYQALIVEHRALQSNYDDAISEKADAVSRLQEVERRADEYRNSKTDALMRTEIDRLRRELQKSEDNLGSAEAELERNSNLVNDLTRKMEDLQIQANQAVKLKDQVDEYRHAAEKVQKIENVMEKYKKKLEESADLRRLVKTLEEQNASLVDKNASLEEEYRKVSTFRPLMESYKAQIVDLENKTSAKTKEIETLRFELEQTQTRLAISVQERAQDVEALELYQERVKELELVDYRSTRLTSQQPEHSSSTDDTGREEDHSVDLAEDSNLGGELNDAISGQTTTDLKLQIRKLRRDLQDAQTNSGDASRVLILENLLEDANRMKTRYESDYLATHREKLLLQSQLEEIRSGKSLGDGPEAVIALRQRLNEVSEQLDALRKEHAQLQVNHESQGRELTVAKSDLHLVNKDQLDILSTLRESVNEDKAGLEEELKKLQNQVAELKEKNKMQLEQVNGLLMEKVNLQSEGIGQREKMLERERLFADMRASVNGKDLPDDIKRRLLLTHEENIQLREQTRTLSERLLKAKALLKEQDRMIRENRQGVPSGSIFEEAEESFRAKIKLLEEEMVRHKQSLKEANSRYHKEQTLMLSYVHALGMQSIRDHQANHRRVPGGIVPPSSWLVQQRKNMGGTLR